MSDDLFIDEHAFKHGLTAAEIEHAWENFAAMQHRKTPNEDEIVVVGTDTAGRFVQMVAVVKPYGILVYHAMRPPTTKVLKELRLKRRTR